MSFYVHYTLHFFMKSSRYPISINLIYWWIVEASGMDDGMFSKGLPPPPHVPHTYATSPEETTPLQDGITD